MAQLHAAPIDASATRPRKELAAVSKVHLASGASEVVTFRLDSSALAF